MDGFFSEISFILYWKSFIILIAILIGGVTIKHLYIHYKKQAKFDWEKLFGAPIFILIFILNVVFINIYLIYTGINMDHSVLLFDNSYMYDSMYSLVLLISGNLVSQI